MSSESRKLSKISQGSREQFVVNVKDWKERKEKKRKEERGKEKTSLIDLFHDTVTYFNNNWVTLHHFFRVLPLSPSLSSPPPLPSQLISTNQPHVIKKERSV